MCLNFRFNSKGQSQFLKVSYVLIDEILYCLFTPLEESMCHGNKEPHYLDQQQPCSEHNALVLSVIQACRLCKIQPRKRVQKNQLISCAHK